MIGYRDGRTGRSNRNNTQGFLLVHEVELGKKRHEFRAPKTNLIFPILCESFDTVPVDVNMAVEIGTLSLERA